MEEAPSHQNRVVIGDLLKSGSSSYLVESVLGQGTFGTVAKCRNVADNKTVAIKMMRNQGYLATQASAEVEVLLRLQLLDSDQSNVVQWYRVFACNQHICLEFEHLDKSLYDFMKERSFQPLLLKEIRPIVKQLANALDHLKAAGLIHTDIKLENIMLVNHAKQPYRVKVIDFGGAHEVSAATQGACIQTLRYRSPEVILGLPYTEATDMWSVGCVAAFLYLGCLLYPGRSEYDMMRFIVETQGHPPNTLLTLGLKTGCFFQRNSKNSFWKLKTPEQFYRETEIRPLETRSNRFCSLYHLLPIQPIRSEKSVDIVSESNDRFHFGDLLSQMLELDAAKRLTPRQVLKHPFTSMHHMSRRYHVSSYVRSCFETVYQNRTTGSAVGGSLQRSSSSAHRVQQNLPSASAERDALSQRQGINPHPCSTTQTSGSVNTGVKRKVGEEKETTSEVRKSSAAPATSSSSICFSPSIKRKMADRGDSDYHQLTNHKIKRVRKNSPGPSNSSCSSCFSPSVKRKMADRGDSDHHQLTDHKIKRVRKNSAAPPTGSERRPL